MGPAGSDRVSRDRPYSGIWIKSPTVFAYRALTFCGASFHSLRLTIRFVTLRPAGRRITPNPTTPERQRLPPSLHSGLGYSHFARHYSGNRGFFPFLGLLRCFSSPAYPACPMDSDKRTRALPRVGFPIRTSRDQRLVSTYSGLIAAAHVLHRPLAPRHPPCALRLLIMKNTVYVAMEFSRCARTGTFARDRRTRSLKTQQRSTHEVDVRSRRVRHRTDSGRSRAIKRADACRSNSSGIPRKEVIQPQLPLRLPCYDFTPITSPTFDGSLPCGLGHRLRVLPAFVV